MFAAGAAWTACAESRAAAPAANTPVRTRKFIAIPHSSAAARKYHLNRRNAAFHEKFRTAFYAGHRCRCGLRTASNLGQMATPETMSIVDGLMGQTFHAEGGRPMNKPFFLKLSLVGAALAVPMGAAAAQAWSPGQEIVGQTVQVQTQGVVNSVYFAPDGTAVITAPTGEAIQGNWSAANNMLCLSTLGGQECWPYQRAFQPGQQVALTSTCQQVSTFMPGSLNPPTQIGAGERG
jgi:hypothetical protein